MATKKEINVFLKSIPIAKLCWSIDDCTEISEDEKCELQREIDKFCEQGLNRLEKKYGISIPRTSTNEVVNSIIFE